VILTQNAAIQALKTIAILGSRQGPIFGGNGIEYWPTSPKIASITLPPISAFFLEKESARNLSPHCFFLFCRFTKNSERSRFLKEQWLPFMRVVPACHLKR
jgi:hypothetical protein